MNVMTMMERASAGRRTTDTFSYHPSETAAISVANLQTSALPQLTTEIPDLPLQLLHRQMKININSDNSAVVLYGSCCLI